MRIIRPDSGATLTNSPQVVEAAVGNSIVRVDFYYHIDGYGAVTDPSRSVMDPPILIGTRDGPPWRVNWQLPQGCTVFVSLLAIGFDACGGGNDSGVVNVKVCRQ